MNVLDQWLHQEEPSSATPKCDLQFKVKMKSQMTVEQLAELDKRRLHGYAYLKTLKTLHGIKFYFCLPNLSREEKLLKAKNITECGGVIKASLSNAGTYKNIDSF